ncbi:SLFN8 protein, partial [Grantiella picta]|nr:SLFN8 protein [Grantiella picta]
MASQEGRLLIDLNTNYADVVVDIGKIHLGKISRKKSSCNQKTERNVLSTAVYALLNSGGGIVKMESEDRNYSFQEHGIGEDIERSLRDCVGGSNTSEYFTWMQKGSNLLLFVKTWTCGGPEQGSAALHFHKTKPRLCSLSTGLFWRSDTSVYPVTSRDVPEFLKKKRGDKWLNENGLSTKRARVTSGEGAEETPLNIEEHDIQSAAARFIKRDKVLVGECLHFTETTHIEFKEYSTKCILQYIRKTLPKYVSAFANTQGGYLFFGVDDDGKVTGSHSDVEKEALKQTVADAIGSTSVYHFCGSGAGVQFQTHILGVYDQAGCSHGYVCAVHIEPSCCPVFDGDPESWMVVGDKIERLSVRKWMELMTAADPDPSRLADDFRIQLSLANGPPQIKPVYCKADLQCVAELQECLYPVDSNEIKWKPETICTNLFSEYPGLEDLLKRQLHGLTRGILILSRSWAVDIGLQKNQDVVCDALLVADNQYPVLFTVVRDASCVTSGNWKETARALKQKLVNDGGYTSRVCVIPQILQLNGTNDQMGVAENDVPWQGAQSDSSTLYPKNYILTSREIPAFLQALVIVVLCFKSYLSDSLGCEIFNLLTLKQYELISSNLNDVRKLFVLGLPGTGKTIVALKLIERIKNTFRCSAEEILYVCENQPLRDFVGNDICQAVTRATFLKKDFPHVKHIVVDEAQNFRRDEGNWYQRAQSIVKERGVFWVFLDLFQTTYPSDCGLDFSNLYPQKRMTKVVRNANQISNAMFDLMSKIWQAHETDVLNEVLEKLLSRAECAHSLSGDYIVKENMKVDEAVKYVTKHCKSYIEQGYRLGDIAILCSTSDEAWMFKQRLQPQLERQIRKGRVREVVGPAEKVLKDIIVLDSIRRFSGLERRIVFVIHPYTQYGQIVPHLLLCAVSRANTKLHLLYEQKR